jgi:hypothetical protein
MTPQSMTAICAVLGIARRSAYYVPRGRPAGRYQRADDGTVLQQIRAVTNSPATYGYRRVWAMVTAPSGPATTASAFGASCNCMA